jgi:hypothetical protein
MLNIDVESPSRSPISDLHLDMPLAASSPVMHDSRPASSSSANSRNDPTAFGHCPSAAVVGHLLLVCTASLFPLLARTIARLCCALRDPLASHILSPARMHVVCIATIHICILLIANPAF